jgi:para-aminobenzoate synthetase/4-amino-4-deoxychorismate lyase
MPEEPDEPVEVAILPLPVEREDFRLRHKTSDRGFYEEARRASGCFEVIFVDPEGFLTEGSFTHLFVERDGDMATPPLSRGLLPGILRARMLEEGERCGRGCRRSEPARHILYRQFGAGLIRARRAL